MKIIAYNELSDLIAEQHDAEARGESDYFRFIDILHHRTAKIKGKQPLIEVLVLWEDGSKTWQDLTSIFKDDPVTVAKYAKDHNLLDVPRWKRCKKIARCAKMLQQMINNLRYHQSHTAIHYKFAVQIPCNYKEAIQLDQANGNTLWQDSVRIEREAITSHDTYHSIGCGVPIPQGYTEIPVHFVFDVKQDLCHKAHLVARWT